ncbi:hypothetical protein [Alkalinema sp. FACHB-956]|uniref:hypothetical protein n=1 Tax=Alkalinema sp. FACHB-956 TaxID=2692768 RepID=UPI0016858978|nr:hypothetical protein [Alkalinema sp. FACHB-956]MBD2326731.1 hypothetical protein [Alkalinema sp. FACHB-956]
MEAQRHPRKTQRTGTVPPFPALRSRLMLAHSVRCPQPRSQRSQSPDPLGIPSMPRGGIDRAKG